MYPTIFFYSAKLKVSFPLAFRTACTASSSANRRLKSPLVDFDVIEYIAIIDDPVVDDEACIDSTVDFST